MVVLRLLLVMVIGSFNIALAWDYQHMNDWWREAPACAGFSQSPINFSSKLSYQAYAPLKIDFMGKEFKVKPHDNGHASGLICSSTKPTVRIGDNEYKIMGLHFHHISEHTIDKKHHDAELHMTLSRDGINVDHVLAILLQQSVKKNQAIDKLVGIVSAKSNSSNYLKAKELKRILPKHVNYYQYVGSLTTPPCTEGIVWYVLSNPVHISHESLKTLKKLHSYNFRPTSEHDMNDIEYHHN